jgi:hypothetical protein
MTTTKRQLTDEQRARKKAYDKSYARKYRERHPDYYKSWCEAHPDYHRSYYQARKAASNTEEYKPIE